MPKFINMAEVEFIIEDIPRTRVPLRVLNPATGFNIDALWKEDREIYSVLRRAESVEEARKGIYDYLCRKEWEYRRGKKIIHPLVESIAQEAIRVLKNIISVRNEEATGYSALTYLWRIARGESGALAEVDEGFILEFIHLFKAINGRAEIYPTKYIEGVEQVDFKKIKGEDAGKKRSNYLDKMADRVWKRIMEYKSGLDADVIEKRRENKAKILDYLGGSEDDWENYMWHFRNVFKGKEAVDKLKDLIKMDEDDIEALLKAAEGKIPFGITPYYLHLFDFENPYNYDYQVRAQVLPPMHTVIEMMEHREERSYYFDFMGEHDTTPHNLITRRYPLIAILKASNTCPQVCVYCQRNWEITDVLYKGGIPTREAIDSALDWFSEHPGIKEVLITGGDPLILPDSVVEHMVRRLSEMEHIISIRIGTRIPVTVPFRITDELASMLSSYIEPGKRNICLVTHVESAYEVTPEMAIAVDKLRKNRIYVYNQQVFTFWVSRRFETAALRVALKKVGIDPYYSFYPKGKWEHMEYVVPVARILQERKEEARLLPGVFRTDEPVFNVPRLGKNHLRAWQDHELIMIRPDGRRMYLWHPWEKNIQLIDPYIYTDIVSIKMYLDNLKKYFNEDIEEYKSIWYYY